MIHRIRVQNFKSLVDVTVDLTPVTVLVGRSGTGKSNFVSALRILRDLLLPQAGQFQQLKKHLQRDWAQLLPAMDPNAQMSFDVEFSISGVSEKYRYQLAISGPTSPPTEEILLLGDKTLFHQQSIEKSPGTLVPQWVVEPELIPLPQAGPIVLGRIPSITEVVIAYTTLTSGIGCYIFSDDVLCGVSKDESISGLDDRAYNYLTTLKDIVSNLQDLNVRKSIVDSLQRINPSVASVELDSIQQPQRAIVGHRFNDKTLALGLSQESDGFRRFYAHLLALYQRPPKQTLIFEHPEDGIHPGALALLAEEFRSAPSNDRGQVILTTHSPQLLDHFDAEQIRVVEIDGFETRIGPMSNEQQAAIQDNLLDSGELLTVDPARVKSPASESAGA